MPNHTSREEEDDMEESYRKPIQCHHVNIAENPFIKRSISSSKSSSSLLSSTATYNSRGCDPTTGTAKLNQNSKSVFGAGRYQSPHRLASRFENPNRFQSPHRFRNSRQKAAAASDVTKNRNLDDSVSTTTSITSSTSGTSSISPLDSKNPSMSSFPDDEQEGDAISIGGYSMQSSATTMPTGGVPSAGAGSASSPSESSILKKRLKKANEKIKIMQQRHKEEQNQWKSQTIELARIKRERQGLIENQRQELQVNENLQRSNEELKNQLETLRNENVGKGKQIDILSTIIGDLEEKAAAKEGNNGKEIQENLRVANEQNNKLQTSNDELNKQFETLHNDIVDKTKEIDVLTRNGNEVQEQLRALGEQKEALYTLNDELRRELEILKKDKVGKENQIELLTRNGNDAEEKLQVMTQQRDQLQTSNDELNQHLESLKNDIINFYNQIDMLKTNTQQMMESNESKIQSITQERDCLEKSNDQLHTQLESTKAECSNHESRSQKLQEELNEVKAAKERDDEISAEERNRLIESNGQLKSQLHSSKSECIDLKSISLKLHEELDEIKVTKERDDKTSFDQVAELNFQVQKLQDELASKQEADETSNDELKARLQSLQDDCTEKDDHIERLQTALDQMTSSKEEYEQTLKKQMTVSEAQKASLNDQIQAFREQNSNSLEKLKAINDGLNSQLQTLQHELMQKDSDIQTLQSDLDQIKGKKEEYERASKDRIFELKSANATLTLRMQVLRKRNSNALEEVRANDGLKTQLQSDLSTAKAQIQELQDLLDEKNQKHCCEQTESSNMISTLNSQIELAQSQLETLRKENKSLSNDNKVSKDTFEKHVERLSLQILDIESERLASNKSKNAREEDREVRESNEASRQSSRASLAELFRLGSGVSGGSGSGIDDEFGHDPSQQVENLQKENKRLERTMERIVTWNDELLKRNESLMERVAELECLYENLKDSKQPGNGNGDPGCPKSPIKKVTQAAMLVDITRKKEREDRERNGKGSKFLDGIFS